MDVKGGVVVDTDSSEAGKMYLDVNGESKTSQIDTLGHEVLETQDFQGKGNGILFSNSEDTQEALGDAFGNQLADRINQAAGGDLDSTGGSASINDKWPATAFSKVLIMPIKLAMPKSITGSFMHQKFLRLKM
ncbi:hypothetical protein [Marinomonas posidonica]|uniref:Uncharacterized protein n=1 Tax=Marinomonas posidonica (strain CECT 7376 / NCIMB 14433 / IVIA-Po-181) TaxID=491952 RepID=F6D148_MARPP|nr:hypothetical protein [Marinomonas posidonica]AEF54855.1 hypothetical protein Mar181_1817 [Marinomonas posidonica IVIA-Po-181]